MGQTISQGQFYADQLRNEELVQIISQMHDPEEDIECTKLLSRLFFDQRKNISLLEEKFSIPLLELAKYPDLTVANLALNLLRQQLESTNNIQQSERLIEIIYKFFILFGEWIDNVKYKVENGQNVQINDWIKNKLTQKNQQAEQGIKRDDNRIRREEEYKYNNESEEKRVGDLHNLPPQAIRITYHEQLHLLDIIERTTQIIYKKYGSIDRDTIGLHRKLGNKSKNAQQQLQQQQACNCILCAMNVVKESLQALILAIEPTNQAIKQQYPFNNNNIYKLNEEILWRVRCILLRFFYSQQEIDEMLSKLCVQVHQCPIESISYILRWEWACAIAQIGGDRSGNKGIKNNSNNIFFAFDNISESNEGSAFVQQPSSSMKKRRHELISLCEELTKRVVMEGDFEAHWATIVHFWISLQEEERMSHIVAQYAEVREKELERETKNPKEKEKERIRQWKEMEKLMINKRQNISEQITDSIPHPLNVSPSIQLIHSSISLQSLNQQNIKQQSSLNQQNNNNSLSQFPYSQSLSQSNCNKIDQDISVSFIGETIQTTSSQISQQNSLNINSLLTAYPGNDIAAPKLKNKKVTIIGKKINEKNNEKGISTKEHVNSSMISSQITETNTINSNKSVSLTNLTTEYQGKNVKTFKDISKQKLQVNLAPSTQLPEQMVKSLISNTISMIQDQSTDINDQQLQSSRSLTEIQIEQNSPQQKNSYTLADLQSKNLVNNNQMIQQISPILLKEQQQQNINQTKQNENNQTSIISNIEQTKLNFQQGNNNPNQINLKIQSGSFPPSPLNPHYTLSTGSKITNNQLSSNEDISSNSQTYPLLRSNQQTSTPRQLQSHSQEFTICVAAILAALYYGQQVKDIKLMKNIFIVLLDGLDIFGSILDFQQDDERNKNQLNFVENILYALYFPFTEKEHRVIAKDLDVINRVSAFLNHSSITITSAACVSLTHMIYFQLPSSEVARILRIARNRPSITNVNIDDILFDDTYNSFESINSTTSERTTAALSVIYNCISPERRFDERNILLSSDNSIFTKTISQQLAPTLIVKLSQNDQNDQCNKIMKESLYLGIELDDGLDLNEIARIMIELTQGLSHKLMIELERLKEEKEEQKHKSSTVLKQEMKNNIHNNKDYNMKEEKIQLLLSNPNSQTSSVKSLISTSVYTQGSYLVDSPGFIQYDLSSLNNDHVLNNLFDPFSESESQPDSENSVNISFNSYSSKNAGKEDNRNKNGIKINVNNNQIEEKEGEDQKRIDYDQILDQLDFFPSEQTSPSQHSLTAAYASSLVASLQQQSSNNLISKKQQFGIRLDMLNNQDNKNIGSEQELSQQKQQQQQSRDPFTSFSHNLFQYSNLRGTHFDQIQQIQLLVQKGQDPYPDQYTSEQSLIHSLLILTHTLIRDKNNNALNQIFEKSQSLWETFPLLGSVNALPKAFEPKISIGVNPGITNDLLQITTISTTYENQPYIFLKQLVFIASAPPFISHFYKPGEYDQIFNDDQQNEDDFKPEYVSATDSTANNQSQIGSQTSNSLISIPIPLLPWSYECGCGCGWCWSTLGSKKTARAIIKEIAIMLGSGFIDAVKIEREKGVEKKRIQSISSKDNIAKESEKFSINKEIKQDKSKQKQLIDNSKQQQKGNLDSKQGQQSQIINQSSGNSQSNTRNIIKLTNVKQSPSIEFFTEIPPSIWLRRLLLFLRTGALTVIMNTICGRVDGIEEAIHSALIRHRAFCILRKMQKDIIEKQLSCGKIKGSTDGNNNDDGKQLSLNASQQETLPFINGAQLYSQASSGVDFDYAYRFHFTNNTKRPQNVTQQTEGTIYFYKREDEMEISLDPRAFGQTLIAILRIIQSLKCGIYYQQKEMDNQQGINMQQICIEWLQFIRKQILIGQEEDENKMKKEISTQLRSGIQQSFPHFPLSVQQRLDSIIAEKDNKQVRLWERYQIKTNAQAILKELK